MAADMMEVACSAAAMACMASKQLASHSGNPLTEINASCLAAHSLQLWLHVIEI